MHSIKKPVLIFLGVILVLSAVIIAIKGIQIPKIPYLNGGDSKEQPAHPKMADIQVQGNKVVIKYSELDIFMAECCKSVAKEVKTEKDGDSIKIKGKATFPFSADFEGNLSPYIENEKVKAKLSNLILGKIESPGMLADKLGSLVDMGFEEKINSKYKAKDVKITKEGIVVTNY